MNALEEPLEQYPMIMRATKIILHGYLNGLHDI
jgi:hypothetical protein